jgi:hypothetical protein
MCSFNLIEVTHVMILKLEFGQPINLSSLNKSAKEKADQRRKEDEARHEDGFEETVKLFVIVRKNDEN